MNNFAKNNKYLVPIIAICIICIINYRWIGFNVFSYGDWHFIFNRGLADTASPSIWTGNAGHGGIDSTFWRTPLNLLFGLFANIGVPFHVSEKILVFWPTIIGLGTSGYLLAYKICKNRLAGILGAIILSFNSYAIASIGQGHILLLTATSLAIVGIISMMNALEVQKDYKHYIISALLLGASGWADLRILYLSFGLLFLYLVYTLVHIKAQMISKLPGLAIFGLITLCINAFWIIPTFVSGGLSSAEVLSRGLFGNNFWNMYSSITFTHPFWGIQYTTWFVRQDVAPYLWLLPMIFIVALIMYRKKKKILVFFGLIGTLGVLLSKQVDAPFPSLYGWLFSNVPGFNAFRESTKFYFYSIIGLIALVSALTLKTKPAESFIIKSFRYSAISIVIIIFSINAFAIVSGTVGKLYSEKQIPKDYSILESFLTEQPGFYRTLWAPAATRWNFSSARTPVISGPALSKAWEKYLPNLSSKSLKDDADLTRLSLLLQSNQGHEILNKSSVRYIIVPLGATDNGDNLYINYEGDRNDYIEMLDSLSYLIKMDIGTDELAVYENQTYYPLVGAANTGYLIDDSENPALLSSFFNNLGNDSHTLLQPNGSPSVLPIARSLFGSPRVEGNNNTLQLSNIIESPSDMDAILYRDIGDSNIWLTLDESSLTIFSKPAKIPQINDTVLDSQLPDTHIIKSFYLDANETYYLRVNNTLTRLSAGTTQYIGDSKEIYSLDLLNQGQNYLLNGSFENGAWQSSIGDCNNYDNNSDIAMSIDGSTSSNGNQSLRLEARRHTACTSTDITISGGEEYLLAFDYNTIQAKTIGYFLEFNDASKTTISGKKTSRENNLWGSQAIDVHSPPDATSVKLYLYSYESDTLKNNVVLYDNVTFSTPDLIEHIDLSTLRVAYEATEIKLVNGANRFELDLPDYANENIILNGSFEDGAWTDIVGDCNNYDGNPLIAMSTSSTASDGVQSLRLDAERHDACTSTDISLGEAGAALLSFDYYTNNKNKMGYRITFNDNANTIIADTIESESPNEWGHYLKEIRVPFGTSAATIYLYAYESDGRTINSVLFDNFKLIKTPDLKGKYFLVSGDSMALGSPERVKFSNLSSSKTSVYVQNQNQPSIISYSQSFDPNWKIFLEPIGEKAPCVSQSIHKIEYNLNDIEYIECNQINTVGFSDISYMTNKYELPATYHYKINNFANGWIIDPSFIRNNYPQQYWEENEDGGINIRLTIYYQPQSYFYIGAIISGFTLASTILYIVWNHIKYRGRSKVVYSAGGRPEESRLQ